MNTSKGILCIVSVLVCAVLCASGCETVERKPTAVPRVTIMPEQTDALLANPGM